MGYESTQPMDEDPTLTTARNARETAFALYKALRLMEDHATAANLEELAFLIGVAGEAAREFVETGEHGTGMPVPDPVEGSAPGCTDGDRGVGEDDDPGGDPVH